MTTARIKSTFLTIVFLMSAVIMTDVNAQVDKVMVVKDANGFKLQVNGRDFMVNGMNWDYFPRGKTYTYSFWQQPENIIKAALDQEMGLLKNMGVNAIRVYTGVQPKWVKYIYEQHGIYTVLNHSFGRYGVTLDGAYIANTDYKDPKTRQQILSEVRAVINEFKETPGVLMWLLGNENNYGLFWGGAETEDIPIGETVETVRAKHMYSLFNEGIKAIKEIDTMRPVAICNGDLLFLDIIKEEIEQLDIFGTNMYRGYSFTDAFERVKNELDAPIFFTEFGADAFNAKENREDQLMQAGYMVANWKDIYEHAYGNGLTGISIGGMTFQFSDGWWKYDQETDLDVHNTNASWANGGYMEDFVEGENNMNEEWFGICAKGPTSALGMYQLYPRAAYYALKDVHSLNPLDPAVGLNEIRQHFNRIEPIQYVLKSRGDKAAFEAEQNGKVRMSGLRMEFETYNTGGDKITTPNEAVSGSDTYPAFLGFDQKQSFYAEFEANPSPNVTGMMSINVLGNVPQNPINEIFYENRGRPQKFEQNGEIVTQNDIERIKVYRASVNWNHEWFNLDGFYRTGHFHWGYEGDFFGLYPEANYGPNIDIYNGAAPNGFELEGKKHLAGLKIAFGPELWWGANPAFLIKYTRKVWDFTVTGIYHEDIDEQGEAVSSFAVPVPPTRRASIHIAYKYGPFGVEMGGLWSGSTKEGDSYQRAWDGRERSYGDWIIYEDNIRDYDALGGKVKLTYQEGIWNWYAESSLQGLVADGGVPQGMTFTGWHLKNSGLGNQYSILTGLAVNLGNWQIAPNFLWQKPIEGPISKDVAAPGRPRNILSDPFAVLGNRETTAGELLVTYDPTPASYMYEWDSDFREDAPFAVSAGVIFRHQPTTRDARIGILADGRTIFAFPGAPPARDLWETHARIVSKLRPGLGLIANLYAGDGESNGSDERLVHRYGGDIRMALQSYKFIFSAKVNDWGPYDYHRDFNLTYPLQLGADFSTLLGVFDWFELSQTQLGVRFAYRSLDKYSPRYGPVKIVNADGESEYDPLAPGYSNGSEWEIRTYLHFNIGM